MERYAYSGKALAHLALGNTDKAKADFAIDDALKKQTK